MTAQRYQAIFDWFRARPAALRALGYAQKISVLGVYLVYGAVLAVTLWQRSGQFWRVLAVPAALLAHNLADIVGTAVLFAAMLVLMFVFDWRMGAACLLAAVVAVTRVLTGVHYPSDVLAGLAFGAGAAVIGFLL